MRRVTGRRTAGIRAGALALALALALMLAGCATGSGGSPDDPVTAPDATSSPSGTDPEPTAPAPSGDVAADLTIGLDETGGGTVVTTTLSCAPVGGDHPDANAACAALEAAGGAEAFAPLPPDATCTEQYGGPQTATVTGTVDGERVDADFSRINGCEIARWDALAPLLGSAGGV
ncbi:SSI family serine proteinase inhibitor [Actinotalea sp.]|uniref:SSI family serine proteinase inhibitor n=1 Tax=Actinotalea sp. TaxID=1872145 RepID=UPI002C173FCD|nr:SSI family serine proteinase inhibitor [Actinotalea sp.]HRA50193.1 SSI family serine proteinase inhibitor [Actinotalea sp.]